MKHMFKRFLALAITLMLVLPTLVVAEETDVGAAQAYEEVFTAQEEVVEAPAEETSEDGPDDTEVVPWDDAWDEGAAYDEDGTEIVAAEPEEAQPFTQTVTLDDVTVTLTADAGVFPADAVLKVGMVEDAQIVESAEAAVRAEGDYAHGLYLIEVEDGEGELYLPDVNAGLAQVRVEGLKPEGATFVAAWDIEAEQANVIGSAYDAEADALTFAYLDPTVYDIVTVTEKAEEPVEETEEPAETEEPVETEEPAEVDAPVAEAQEPAAAAGTDEGTDEPVEGEGAEEPAEEAKTVAVTFKGEPAEAVVTVYADGEVVEPGEDGAYALVPGTYSCDIEAEGYIAEKNVLFDVMEDEEDHCFEYELELNVLDASVQVNDMVVRVKSDIGAFTEDAKLYVEPVSEEKAAQAEEAIKDVRDEGQNVVASYMINIKVLDAWDRELQPAEGKGVEVMFTLDEAADENLTASVYHVTQDASGALSADKLDAQADRAGRTVKAQADGFSLYAVEFTYDTLDYVFEGMKSAALQDILTSVGLLGEAESVTVSDASLLAASNEMGEWVVAPVKAFDTEASIKVAINGVEYEIDVTVQLEEITLWTDLQALIDEAEAGQVFTLTDDLFAEPWEDPALTIAKGKDITIDLNGHALDRAMEADDDDGSVIIVDGKLTIRDSVGGGEIRGGNTTGNGGGIVVNAGATCAINGVTITGNTAVNGGGIVVNADATCTMEGVTITGNTADNGGGVLVKEKGACTMEGGAITDNTANKHGGAVYVENRSRFVMKDGTISGNTATEKGGAVFSDGRTMYDSGFFMQGGAVKDNEAEAGGGVYINRVNALEMSGGSITGNTPEDVYLNDRMRVRGNVQIGNAYMDYYLAHQGYVAVYFDIIGALDPDARIGVTPNDELIEKNGSTIVAGSYSQGADLPNFVVTDPEKYALSLNEDNEIILAPMVLLRLHKGLGDTDEMIRIPFAKGAKYELPGAEIFGGAPEHMQMTGWRIGVNREKEDNTRAIGETITMEKETDVTALWLFDWAGLVEMVDQAADGDTIMLPSDVTRDLEDREHEYLTIPEEKSLTLDLNGYTLDGNGGHWQLIQVEGALNIKDGYGGGKLTGGGEWGCVYVDGGDLTLTSGAISGNVAENDSAVSVNNGGTFTMLGGEISGNTNNRDGAAVSVNRSTFDLIDGRITGNKADFGGAVEIDSSSTFNMSGGVISGNTATWRGGGVNVDASTFNMTGGIISGNTANYTYGGEGGGVNIGSGTFNMSGGVISGNTARGSASSTARGGGVHVGQGTFNMTGGEIKGNKAVSGAQGKGLGGGVYAGRSAIAHEVDLNLKGGSITGNAADLGGGVYLDYAGFTLADGGIVTGNTAALGGAGLAFERMTLDLPAAGGIAGNTVNGAESDYYMARESRFDVTEQLGEDFVLDLTADLSNGAPVIVTKDIERANVINFTSADSEYGIALDSVLNIVYGKKVNVTFDKGSDDASGEMADDCAVMGAVYTMPTCTFTAPFGSDFLGWKVGPDDKENPRMTGSEIPVDDSALTDGELRLIAVWGEGLHYVDEYGNDLVRSSSSYTYLSDVPDVPGVTLTRGWYVARGETFENRVTIQGDVNIIIMNAGSTADEDTGEVKNGGTTRMNGGIQLVQPNSLTIWGQEGWSLSGAGRLEANTAKGGTSNIDMAGIGGDTHFAAGAFIMHSGVVEATGRTNAAGLGGGLGSAGGVVTIYNGKLTARGGAGAAGIGGGFCAGQGKGAFTIYNGTVYAYGGNYAAGIGGGQNYNNELGDENVGGNGSLVNCYGGTVYAQGGVYAAGIGGGQGGNGGAVTISEGCTVTAVAGKATGKRVVEANQPQAIGRGYMIPTVNEKPGSIAFSEGANVFAGADEASATGYTGDERYEACHNIWARVAAEDIGDAFKIYTTPYNPDHGTVGIFNANDLTKPITSALEGETVVVKVTTIDEGIFDGLLVHYSYSEHWRPLGTKTHEKEGRTDTYTFVMPKGEVRITLRLTAKVYDIRYGSFEHGTIKATVDGIEVKQASKGDEVTVTVSPDADDAWFLHEITYTDEAGAVHKMIQAKDENVHTFTMPASSVTINPVLRQGVKFINEKGKEDICRYYDTIGGGTTTWSGGGLADGWYLITGNVTISGRVNVTCDAHLIVADGATLSCKKGMRVRNGTGALTVYGQKGQSGLLKADAEDESNKAGIGGNKDEASGSITINGATVKAWGGDSAAAIGGGTHGACTNVTVNRGSVYAYGNTDGPGIGGGEDRSITGKVIINGGYVYAKGGEDGAGVGGGEGGSQGGEVIVNGGTLEARGGHDAAGVGGGDVYRGGGNGGTVTVNGGTLYAYGGQYGAGIGGGNDGKGGTLNVNGGYVYAKGGEEGAGVGGAESGDAGTVNVNGGTLEAYGGDEAPGIGGGDDGDGNCNVTVSGGYVYAKGGDGAAGIGGGYNEKGGTVRFNGGTIEAVGNNVNCAIGGGKKNSNNGSLYLCDAACTRTGNDGFGSYDPVSSRVYNCQHYKYARITICTHPDTAFTYRQYDHTHHIVEGTCRYCKNSGKVSFKEKHVFDSEHKCRKCGYQPLGDLTISVGEHGTAKLIGSDKNVEWYSKVRIRIEPDDGYEFDKINQVLDGTVVIHNVNYTITTTTEGQFLVFDMPTAKRVRCNIYFKPKDYNIYAEYNKNLGTVEVPASGNVDETITVHVTPNEGYRLAGDGIYVTYPNGGRIEVTKNRTFTMPASDVTVWVTFERRPSVDVYEVFEDEESGDWGMPEGPLMEQPIGSYTVPAGQYAEQKFKAAYYSLDDGETLTEVAEGDTITWEDGPKTLYIYYQIDDSSKPRLEKVLIKGDTFIDETLTAAITPAGAEDVTYQWYRDGKEIEGATDESYLLTDEDVGKHIGVRATQTNRRDTVTKAIEVGPVQAPKFTRYDLLLSGQIGVRFYIQLPGGAERYKGTQMSFTINGKTTTQPVEAGVRNGDGWEYIFTFYVNSIQMADTIDVNYAYGYGFDHSLDTHASVASYISYVQTYADYFEDDVVDLVNALGNYGHYAQEYLSPLRRWTLGEGKDHEIMPGNAEITKEEIEEIKEKVKDFGISKDPTGSGISKVTFSLMLDSETAINLYFYKASGFTGDINYAYDDVTGVAEKVSGRYRAMIRNISAHKLGDMYTVKVTTDRGSFDVKVSALSYVKVALEDPYSPEEEAAAAALYNYYSAARAALAED